MDDIWYLLRVIGALVVALGLLLWLIGVLEDTDW